MTHMVKSYCSHLILLHKIFHLNSKIHCTYLSFETQLYGTSFTFCIIWFVVRIPLQAYTHLFIRNLQGFLYLQIQNDKHVSIKALLKVQPYRSSHEYRSHKNSSHKYRSHEYRSHEYRSHEYRSHSHAGFLTVTILL